MVLENVTFLSNTTCECTAATSVTIGSGVTIKDGATVTFKSKIVKIEGGFHAEGGSTVIIRKE